jgi:hypothetical protein
MKVSELKERCDQVLASHHRHNPNPPLVVIPVKEGTEPPDFWKGCPVYITGKKDQALAAFNARQLKVSLRYHTQPDRVWFLQD